MEFRLLGPVEMWVNGEPIVLGPPKQRCVLAALLVDAGCPVAQDILIDRVWGEFPPGEVRSTFHTYLTRLRRILRRATAPGGVEIGLVRRSGGYVLDLDPGLVDLHQFRSLTGAGRQDAVSDEPRHEILARAVALWRGTPLGGLQGLWVGQVRNWLDGQHVNALAELADAHQRLGRYSVAVDLLREALIAHPLSEALMAALVRALHGAGRDAEALVTYAQFRQQIVDELGVEPGAELRTLHGDLLAGTRADGTGPVPHSV